MSLEQLTANLADARQARKNNDCQETREAYKAAWQALENATPRRKVGSFASRAGRRQQAERRAR